MKKDFINWLEKEYLFTNLSKYPNEQFTTACNEYRKDLRMAKDMAIYIVKQLNDLKQINDLKNSNNKYDFWTYLVYKKYKGESKK